MLQDATALIYLFDFYKLEKMFKSNKQYCNLNILQIRINFTREPILENEGFKEAEK